MATSPQTNVIDGLFAGGGEMGALMRSLDWSKTPLGAVETWPQSLKTCVSICLNSRFAIRICWGRELVMLYNDAYISVAGGKHPKALGSRVRDIWPEIWDTIGPMLNRVMEEGEATWADDLMLPMKRNGYVEECYFTFSYSPIRDESGGVGGVFTPVTETTERVIAERRIKTLQKLATIGGSRAKNAKDACSAAAKVLSGNLYDLPFAAIYLFDRFSADQKTRTTLVCCACSPARTLTMPETIDLEDNAWSSCSRIVRNETCTIDLTATNLFRPPKEPWGASPEQAIGVPIVQPGDNAPIGFLLAGISIRKRLDAEYREFYSNLGVALAGAIRESETLQRERALRAQAEAERAKIRELFLNAPAGIAILRGPDHRFTLVNDNYLQLVGRASPEELVDRPLVEALPELEEQGIIQILDDVYRSGVPFIGDELLLRLKGDANGDSERLYFNFLCQPTRDVEGRTEGIFVLAIDVTGNVLARRELETREEQFRVLADSIPQLAWMAHPDGSLFWYNRRWYEYTGTTFEQMEGWGWQAVHDPEVLPRVLARYKRSIEIGEPFDMTFPLRGADGRFRSFLTRALPVRDAGGTIVRWFGTNTDVEGQQKTEAALLQSEKLAAVGRLASSIAHEINNPLEAVTNLIYLARSAAVNEDAKVYLESAQQELDRVSQITNQTLRFHKQQSAPSATDIVELTDSIMALYRGKLARDGIQLQMDVKKCPPLMCYAGEVRQVLANLVGNALEAMPKGGTLRFRVRPATDWRRKTPGIRVTVADTGHGMPAETRKRIYEPFFTTKGETGTGLGLWVSAGIIDKHAGSMHVRSSARPGASWTVFTVILPLDGAGTPPVPGQLS